MFLVRFLVPQTKSTEAESLMSSDGTEGNDGSDNMIAVAACQSMWTALELGNPIFSLVLNLLTKFQGECEMLSGNPAISLGITLGGSVHLPMGEGGYTNVGGTNAGAIGAELGVAVDANGNKMCYVGYCVASGFQFQLPPKAGDAGVGFMLSLWKDAGE